MGGYVGVVSIIVRLVEMNKRLVTYQYVSYIPYLLKVKSDDELMMNSSPLLFFYLNPRFKRTVL